MDCNNPVFFKDGIFFIKDEKGNCVPIQFYVPPARAGGRGKQGAPGTPGTQGPPGPVGPIYNLFAYIEQPAPGTLTVSPDWNGTPPPIVTFQYEWSIESFSDISGSDGNIIFTSPTTNPSIGFNLSGNEWTISLVACKVTLLETNNVTIAYFLIINKQIPPP